MSIRSRSRSATASSTRSQTTIQDIPYPSSDDSPDDSSTQSAPSLLDTPIPLSTSIPNEESLSVYVTTTFWQTIHCHKCDNPITITHCRSRHVRGRTDESFKFSQKDPKSPRGMNVIEVPLYEARRFISEGGWIVRDMEGAWSVYTHELVWEELLAEVKRLVCERFWAECWLQMFREREVEGEEKCEGRVLEAVVKVDNFW